MLVGLFENFEDFLQRAVRRGADIDRKTVVSIGNSLHMAGGEEDVIGRPLVARSRLDIKRGKRRVREELDICHQSGYRLVFAVSAQVAEPGLERLRLAGQHGHGCVTIVEIALRLRLFDAGQLLLSLGRLVGARAEHYHWLMRQIIFQKQSQPDRISVFERKQAGDISCYSIEIGTGDGPAGRAEWNRTFEILGIQMNRHAHLPQIGRTRRSASLMPGLAQSRQQYAYQQGQYGYDYKQLNKREARSTTFVVE